MPDFNEIRDEDLVDAVFEPLRRFIGSRLKKDQQEVSDIYQEVVTCFIDTGQSAVSQQGYRSREVLLVEYRKWCFKVARNKIAAWYRARRPTQLACHERWTEFRNASASSVEINEEVHAAIAALRPLYALVIQKVWIDLQCRDQVALALGIRPEYLSLLLYRAKNDLRTYLAADPKVRNALVAIWKGHPSDVCP